MSGCKIDDLTYKGFDLFLYQDKHGYYSCNTYFKENLCFSITGYEDIDEIESQAYDMIDNANLL